MPKTKEVQISAKSRPVACKMQTSGCFRKKAESDSQVPDYSAFHYFLLFLRYILYHKLNCNTRKHQKQATQRTYPVTHVPLPKPLDHIHTLRSECLAEVRKHCHRIRSIIVLVFACHRIRIEQIHSILIFLVGLVVRFVLE